MPQQDRPKERERLCPCRRCTPWNRRQFPRTIHRHLQRDILLDEKQNTSNDSREAIPNSRGFSPTPRPVSPSIYPGPARARSTPPPPTPQAREYTPLSFPLSDSDSHAGHIPNDSRDDIPNSRDISPAPRPVSPSIYPGSARSRSTPPLTPQERAYTPLFFPSSDRDSDPDSPIAGPSNWREAQDANHGPLASPTPASPQPRHRSHPQT